jgi:hypothetical protein
MLIGIGMAMGIDLVIRFLCFCISSLVVYGILCGVAAYLYTARAAPSLPFKVTHDL